MGDDSGGAEEEGLLAEKTSDGTVVHMGPALYEIGVRGRLGAMLSDAVDGLVVISSNEDETRLRGWVVDQASLYGLLDTISSLGLELTGVSKLDSARISTEPPSLQ